MNTSSTIVSQKEYLKKYVANTVEENNNKNKMKIKNPDHVLIVDKDPVWQKPASIEEEEDDDVAGDISPPRRNRPDLLKVDCSMSQDMSPPRRKRSRSPTDYFSVEDVDDVPRTGLLSAEEMKKEIARKKKDELAMYKELDPLVSGRGAEPIYRDKEGNRISRNDILKLQRGDEKSKEKDLEWGTGLVQKREAEAKQRELELEKERPFGRAVDDPELDKMLKEQVRWGDPMAYLVKPKQAEFVLEDFSENEKMKESGFIIPQSIPNHSWIGRRIDAPGNRYGIKPGRHWDGVDRSNGYEKGYFGRSNEKQANEREAYLWSVSDM